MHAGLDQEQDRAGGLEVGTVDHLAKPTRLAMVEARSAQTTASGRFDDNLSFKQFRAC